MGSVPPLHVRQMREKVSGLNDYATLGLKAYKKALVCAETLGISHPVIEELRAVLKDGRRILARSADLAKRIP